MNFLTHHSRHPIVPLISRTKHDPVGHLVLIKTLYISPPSVMHKTSKEYKPLNLPLVTVPNYNLVWLYVTHWILFYFAWYSCLLDLNISRFLTGYTPFSDVFR